MTKKGSFFRLRETTIEKIKVAANEKKMSQAEVIEFVFEEYFADRSVEHKLLKDMVSKLMDEKLSGVKEDLKRVRATGNVIDWNLQMTMEFWNHYFVVNEFKTLGSTLMHKTSELKEAEKIVRDRIAHNRQRKLDSESK